jgi:hypothetical protein
MKVTSNQSLLEQRRKLAQRQAARITEDDPRWNWRHMGNHRRRHRRGPQGLPGTST